jgi:ribosome-binding protein aMBF1 (putative translation factor)
VFLSFVFSLVSFSFFRYAPSVVHRFVHEEMQVYDSIVEKFFSDDINEIVTVILSHEKTLQNDNNYGLAKQLIDIWKNNKITKISKSFLSLSLTDIAETINYQSSSSSSSSSNQQPQQHSQPQQGRDSIDNLEKIIFAMISKERIVASIMSTDNIVHFEESSNFERDFEKKKAILTNTVDSSMNHILKITDLIRDSQKDILTSRDYINKVTSSARSGPGGVGAGSAGGGGGFWPSITSMDFS